MNRVRVLLLFGGESSEHDVSISSARNVYAAINDDKYDIVLGYIDRQGSWWLLEEFDDYVNINETSRLYAVPGSKSFIVSSDNEEVYIDVILPILHGKNGEDGTVQGMAHLMHIPIVGCDVMASSIAMNKVACKEILTANNISNIPYAVHRAYEEIPEYAKITSELGTPLFVKPARSGSSVGISRVTNESEFYTALKNAHMHDSIVLIERAITGQELEVAVLGTPPNHKASGVGEIIPGEVFYTYDDKYASDSMAKTTVEAEIDDVMNETIRHMALEVFERLDCRGLARVDFILDDNGTPYVLEVNTMPGFTNISMYPKLWKQQGISYAQLIEDMIADALMNDTIKT